MESVKLALSISCNFNQINEWRFFMLALAGIWTRDFPGTKPICYQLSYPGLDQIQESRKKWIMFFLKKTFFSLSIHFLA